MIPQDGLSIPKTGFFGNGVSLLITDAFAPPRGDSGIVRKKKGFFFQEALTIN
jgi:hypothetical protein